MTISGLSCILMLKNENRYIYGPDDEKPKYTMLYQQLLFLEKFVESVYIIDGYSIDGSNEIYKEFINRGLIKKVLNDDDVFEEAKSLGILKNLAYEDKNKWILCLDGDEVLEDFSIEWIRDFCSKQDPNINHTIRFKYINLWRSRKKYRFDKWYCEEAGKLFSLTKDLYSYGTEFNNHHFAFNDEKDFGKLHCTDLFVIHYGWVNWNNIINRRSRFIDLEMRFNKTSYKKASEIYNSVMNEDGIVLKDVEPSWLEEYR